MSVIHYRIRFAHPLRSLAADCRKQAITLVNRILPSIEQAVGTSGKQSRADPLVGVHPEFTNP